MRSREGLGVAVPRQEGAQGGARRGRANGDGAERLRVGGGTCAREVADLPLYRRRAPDRATDGPAVHDGRPTDEAEHDTWKG
jgi:hypothetical protein